MAGKTDGVIVAQNLRKSYGTLEAVKGVSFSIKAGEFFGLLGPNGSGKTTIVRLLTGQMKPSGGRSRVLSLDPAKDPVGVRSIVGIIPDQANPPSFLTAEEYLEFVAGVRKLGPVSRKIDWWFSHLDFEESRQTLCKDLSQGTRQKLMFAQAFLHDPHVAFIDEPLINLDPIIQNKVKDYMRNFVRDGGTVFFCTHVLEIAEQLCTRVAVIQKGKILREAKLSDLKKRRESLNSFFMKTVRG
jgi:ABC-2 type transport system ATP-binding protein